MTNAPTSTHPSLLQAFQQLSPETRKNATLLYDFIGQHFSPPGADLIPLNLTDFHEHASVLGK